MSIREVAPISIRRPPIHNFNAKTNRWHNIGVGVVGGGIRPGCEAQLPFSGKRYALNPSVRPARALDGGRLLVSDDVCTTGASLAAAAAALRGAGAREVWALTAARTPRPGPF